MRKTQNSYTCTLQDFYLCSSDRSGYFDHCTGCMGIYGEFEEECRIHWSGCNPWALPKQFYYQNFVVAFQDARMGDFFLNSFIVTALALALLLILALPASYVLARFKFRGRSSSMVRSWQDCLSMSITL